MRLKKVKGASEKLRSSPYCLELDKLEINEKIWDNNNQVHLEIGIGKGQFLTTLAKLNPHINYLGVEMFDSVIIRAIEKAETACLNNIKFIRCDALLLNDKFDKYFSHIYLNFSDPWPKNRHEKRRLTFKTFLDLYNKILKVNSCLTFKTDNSLLFEYSVKSVNNYGCIINKFSIDLHNSIYNKDNICTEFENKFSSLGEKIKMLEIKF
ncbi:MAG: tRNA (guanosine(46)-N7)-methyltransferase TrmB [Bacilli bacterium]